MSRAVVALSSLVAALALVAAAAGLLVDGGPGRSTVVSARGEAVELDGRGLYRNDSVFKAAANRGSDALTLAVALPLLVAALALFRRGSARGALLLPGALTWFLYVYASVALGTAYNELFLVYVALLSASLAAFVPALLSLDADVLRACLAEGLPRRAIGVFMLVCGLLTSVVWIGPLLGPLAAGEPPPGLELSTTLVTHALDLAVITPACVLAGVLLLWRRDPLGYVVAFPLLVLLVLIGPMIAAQTAFQLDAGISFTTAEIVGPIAGFVVLAAIGTWVLARVLRALGPGPLGASAPVPEEAARLNGSSSAPVTLSGGRR